MYKTDFYITMNKNHKIPYEKKSGWGELAIAPDGTPVEVRFDKRNGYWHITEESTGMCFTCNGFKTRKMALEWLEPDILQRTADALKKQSYIDMQNRLANFILNEHSEDESKEK